MSEDPVRVKCNIMSSFWKKNTLLYYTILQNFCQPLNFCLQLYFCIYLKIRIQLNLRVHLNSCLQNIFLFKFSCRHKFCNTCRQKFSIRPKHWPQAGRVRRKRSSIPKCFFFWNLVLKEWENFGAEMKRT